jgi:hypothetical protein
MKSFSLALGLMLVSPTLVSGQVTVEVSFPQKDFLAGEAIPTTVQVKNRSGQTLHLGSEPDWLTFVVESRDGFVVIKTGDVPVLGKFDLESSQVATKRVDLAPYFVLPEQGRYNVTATLRIKDWNQEISSKPASFDIIDGAKLWSENFGVPLPAGVTNTPPEVRKFTLEQANYLRSELRLYLRLTDATGERILKVVPIGPMVSFGQPEAEIDKSSKLHVLYQNGARSFNYSVFDADAELIVRQTYYYNRDSRPRLKADQDGGINVMGGERRANPSDFPPESPANDRRQARP